MTIARVSRAGRSDDLQSLEADKDELENDADHKELMSTYGCDDYLLRWLPNIVNHEHVSPATTKPSQYKERRDKVEVSERLCTTPVLSETFLKSTSRYHQTKETDVYISSGNKVFRETGRLTYLEAIKCSPMKLRQSTTTHKRTTVSSLIVSQQNSQKPVKERVSTSTQDPVRQLGSLCFQTKNAARRPTEAPYSSYHLVGGKMNTSRRNAHYKTGAKKGSELRVRCESVMIYPKALVPSGNNEKPLKKPTKPRKEAWSKETSSAPDVKSDEVCTKLPHLGAKKGETASSEEKQNRKLSPELGGNLKAEQEQKESSSNRSASMKIIIPFGDDQEPQDVEGFGKPVRPTTLKPDVLERKSSQATRKVHNEQTFRKKGEHFYDNQKEYSPNSSEKSRRRITSMVITQLGTSRKTLWNNPSSASATPNAPLTKMRTGTVDTNGLSLGRENLLRQRAGARFSYNQRRAADLGIQNKDRVLPERGKCLLSTENGVSLTIGGTGLLREHRGLHENFGKGEEIEDTDEQPGCFRNSLPHSHHMT